MKLNVRLSDILEKRNITQKELATKTGLRPAAISELANNQRRSINRDHIERIAKALNITDISELLTLRSDHSDNNE